MTKVALVLSGCGVFDGSEIHEAVSALIHLSRGGAAVTCFAPDKAQAQVVDHRTQKPADGEQRNVLTEAARIARGDIKPLSELHAREFDAVVFPGGFGAAKNLCDFADKGADCAVDAEVERVLKDFHDSEKAIGMCCIAPVLAAKAFGASGGCTLTMGGRSEASEAAEKMGATHQTAPVTETVVDEKNRLTTAPAYMYGDAPVHEVHEGIGKMIERTLEFASATATA